MVGVVVNWVSDEGSTARTTQLPIVVIDRQRLSRECLAHAISTRLGLTVIGFATTDEWLHQRAQASLLLICQTGMSAAAARTEIDRLSEPDIRALASLVAVLSDNEDPDFIVCALGQHIRGYIPTSLCVEVAIRAVQLVIAGGVYVPPGGLLAASRLEEEPLASPKKKIFTPRQVAVVEAVRRGKPNKIIAHELQMRESTVKVHVRNIMRKLRATNRTQVAYLANQLRSSEEVSEDAFHRQKPHSSS